MKRNNVIKSILRRKNHAERQKKRDKKPRVPWKWAQDSAGTSMKAITDDVTSETKLTFKEYLINEAKYYLDQDTKENKNERI